MILLVIRRGRLNGLAFSMVAGVSILLPVLPGLRTVISAFSNCEKQVGPLYFGIILKVVAISYIADLGASICRDANENLIASRIEMAGKILILVCSIPIIQGIVELIRTLLA